MASLPEPQARAPYKLVSQMAFIAVAALGVFGFVQAAKNDELRSTCSATCILRPSYAGRNRVAPDFTLKDLDGKEHTLSSYRGKTVVLNFWASWCDPCREEMPALAQFAMQHREQGEDVVLLTITVDEDIKDATDTLTTLFAADEELNRKIKPGQVPFVVLHDPDLRVAKNLYGSNKYPETWIIDPKGFIRARYDGARDWSSALAFEAVRSITRGSGCLADFADSKPAGPYGRLCESD